MKANGVFPWVSLVFKNLLEGRNEADGLSESMSIVQTVPKTLRNRVYSVIWASTKGLNFIDTA